MNLRFKRNGQVFLGKYEVGYLWKPDPRKRFSMGRKGVWNYQWGGLMRRGSGLKLVHSLGMDVSYTNPRFLDLKSEVRGLFTSERIKKLAAHCEAMEKDIAEQPPLSEEDRAALTRLSETLNGML